MKWVKMRRYLELSGDTEDAVQKKVARGLWLDGLHYKTGPDNVRWFNIEAIEQWVEHGIIGDQAMLTRRRASGSASSGPGRG
jgi:hypothetical protein